MSAVTKGIYIIAAKRTAFGTYGGAFRNVDQKELQKVAAKAALDSVGLSGEQIDTVIIGNVFPGSTADGMYLARYIGLQCGIPIEKPALSVNRLCGSGFQSIVNGAQDILMGSAKVALTGGVDNMTQIPLVARNMRFGTTWGATYDLEDALWAGLSNSYGKLSMAMTGENLAEQYKITRERADQFALRSQQNWAKAQKEGVFNTEIAPIRLQVKGKEFDFKVDEHPRPQTTIEALAKLTPSFKKNGVVTAGTASGISDGAAAVILASEDAVKEYNLKPLARLVAYSYVGVKPEIMGFGPVPAIQNLLKVSGKKLEDIDLFEINEAFAAQALACTDALGLDMTKLNVHGGAIAMGHPLAASGSRIAGHLAHEMQRKKLKYTIGSACIGGGQGIAVLLESA